MPDRALVAAARDELESRRLIPGYAHLPELVWSHDGCTVTGEARDVIGLVCWLGEFDTSQPVLSAGRWSATGRYLDLVPIVLTAPVAQSALSAAVKALNVYCLAPEEVRS